MFHTLIASNYFKIILTHTKLEAGNLSFNNHTSDTSDVELMQVEADNLFFNEENSKNSHNNSRHGKLKSYK